ncbi:MAG: choice-of-anchor tandem repeat GloVer-containing protein [Verrucomicrobiota bacterium]
MVGLDTSDTEISVFPDGTVVHGQSLPATIAGYVAAIEGRLLDLQFVLDELESLNAGDPRLGGRLDLANIGAFGWSLGGCTTAQLCLRDPRCKAGVGMDAPYLETNVLTQPLGVPWLFFRSDLDPGPAAWYFGLPGGVPDDRLQVYNEQVTNAYWVKLVSTDHGSFGDWDLIVDSAKLEAGFATPMSGQFLPPARVSQIIRAYQLSFFNKFLQGQDDHLLDGRSPAYPEVIQFLSKSGLSVPPQYPSAALVQGSDGNFYGTTEYGGASGEGTVFQVTTNGTLTTLVSFNGTNGSYPFAGLVQGSDSNFYGTTQYGGTNENYGTVFEMTPAGALTTLVSFNGTNGSYPAAALVQGTNGNFYGTTQSGGASGMGTVFEVTSAGVLTTLVSFNNTDGAVPLPGLVQGTNGNFYGTTFQGGDVSIDGLFGNSGGGTVFEMTPAGVLTRLVEFSGANGENPAGGLVQGTNGNFYGTTSIGGNLSLNAGYGFGTVFKMTPGGALTTLVSFNLTNGYNPTAALVQGSDGNFYGTTTGGGAGVGGTVFKMTPAGVLTTLVSFNGANGSQPSAGLVQGSDGNFYGTAEYGGANGLGTVFQVTTNGTLTTLVSFGGQTNAP